MSRPKTCPCKMLNNADAKECCCKPQKIGEAKFVGESVSEHPTAGMWFARYLLSVLTCGLIGAAGFVFFHWLGGNDIPRERGHELVEFVQHAGLSFLCVAAFGFLPVMFYHMYTDFEREKQR